MKNKYFAGTVSGLSSGAIIGFGYSILTYISLAANAQRAVAILMDQLKISFQEAAEIYGRIILYSMVSVFFSTLLLGILIGLIYGITYENIPGKTPSLKGLSTGLISGLTYALLQWSFSKSNFFMVFLATLLTAYFASLFYNRIMRKS